MSRTSKRKSPTRKTVSSREKVRAHRERLRAQGLRPIQICAITSDPTDAPLFRPAIEPSETNGLRVISRLMVDKITTIPKTKLGARIGRLADKDLVRLNRAMMIFLGLGG